MQHFSQLLLLINENILLTAQKFALETISAVFLANQIFSLFAFALCIHDFKFVLFRPFLHKCHQAAVAFCINRPLQPYSKTKLGWSPTWAKFCWLIASLSVVLPQLNMTKLKLEYLKFCF